MLPVSTPQPGWYPDPQDAGRQRYWDGAAWTEHVSTPDPAATTPIPAAPSQGVPSQPATPQAPTQPVSTGAGYGAAYGTGGGYGTGTGAGTGAGTGYGSTPGGYGTTPQQASTDPAPTLPYAQGQGYQQGYGTGYGQGYGQLGYQQPGYQQPGTGYSTTPPEPPKRSNGGLVAAIIVIAVLVIGGAIFAIMQLSGGDDTADPVPVATLPSSSAPPSTDPSSDPPATDDGSAPTDGTDAGGAATVLEWNTTTPGSVPAGASTQATIVVPQDGLYVFGAIAPKDTGDLVMNLTGMDRVIDTDDAPEAERWWASNTDPVIATILTAGEYVVTVSEYSNQASDFTWVLEGPLENVDLLANGTTQITVDAEKSWIGAVQVPEGATLTVTADSTDGQDPLIAIQGPAGDIWENDDTDDTTKSASQQLTGLAAGPYSIMVGEYSYAATEVLLTVTIE